VNRPTEAVELCDHERVATTGIQVFKSCGEGRTDQGLTRYSCVYVQREQWEFAPFEFRSDRGFLCRNTGTAVSLLIGRNSQVAEGVMLTATSVRFQPFSNIANK
jgi:hypothetical protein